MSSGFPSRSASRRPRVMVVSDHDDTREMYSVFLASVGYDVTQATCETAVSEAVRTLPVVIAADLGLPLDKALNCCRALREHPMTRHTPMLAITGHESESVFAEAVAAGCARVLRKPCEPDTFLYEITKVLPADPSH